MLAGGGLYGVPGAGGVSRGRGDAALTWGEESSGRAEDFEAHTLDPAKYLDPASFGLLGVSSTVPEAKPEDESSGLVEVEASSGGSAWKRRLAPRHRSAVKSFFAGADSTEDDR